MPQESKRLSFFVVIAALAALLTVSVPILGLSARTGADEERISTLERERAGIDAKLNEIIRQNQDTRDIVLRIQGKLDRR